jgi:hypothetical protein
VNGEDGHANGDVSTGPATPPADTASARADASAGVERRAKGALREAVLKVLQDHPDTSYKVSQLCRLVDQAAGADAKTVSAGAVANAVDRLAGQGVIARHDTSPATFQAN